MSQKATFRLDEFREEISVEVTKAHAYVEALSQCWVLGLAVSAQGMRIVGWAFLSEWWSELLFERYPTGQPPHFISGKPVENTMDNDLLSDLASHVGVPPHLLGKKLITLVNMITFAFPNLYLCGSDFRTAQAKSLRYRKSLYSI